MKFDAIAIKIIETISQIQSATIFSFAAHATAKTLSKLIETSAITISIIELKNVTAFLTFQSSCPSCILISL
jgi:hypothetical protein